MKLLLLALLSFGALVPAAGAAQAQTHSPIHSVAHSLSGTVRDADGQPLPGVNV